jgi:hypothetical protein
MIRMAVSTALLSFALGLGTAFAQAPAPNPTPAPAAHPAAPAGMSSDKKAISKSCSDQANAKGLHGKARKKFRSDCKHNGGKA